MPTVQDTLPIQLKAPVGDSKLVIHSLHCEERISGLFHYTVEMVCPDNALDFTQIVGKAITITMVLPSGDKEHRNGIVGRFVQAGKNSRYTTYYADVHPWLWLTSMNSDCRIFQNKSAPDIIK